MKYILIVVLLFIYVVFTYYGYKKYRNIFHPITFFNIYSMIMDIPRLVFIKELFNYGPISNEEFVYYFAVKITFVIIVDLVLLLNKKKSIFKLKSYENNPVILRRFIYVSFLVGFIAESSKIYYIGGLKNLFENMSSRTEILSGSGLFSLFTILLPVSVAAYMVYMNQSQRDYKKKLVFIVMIMITTFFMVAFGSRTGLIRFILILFFVYNFKIKKISFKKIFNFKYLVMYVFVFFFIVSIPQLRLHKDEQLFSNLDVWFKYTLSDSERIFKDISSVDRDIFAINYFVKNDKWYGKNYMDLIYVPIPRSILSNKPPKDDGVYLANLIQGYNVQPNTGFNDFVFKSSAPWSNIGILFSNFGIIGISLGAFLYSKILLIFYNLIISSKYNFILIYAYTIIITQFTFSNLQIVNVSLLLIIPLLFYMPITKAKVYKLTII